MENLTMLYVDIWSRIFKQRKKIIPVFIGVLVLIFFLVLSTPEDIQSIPQNPAVIIEPTDIPFTTYQKPTLSKKERYNIYLLGDSMTHAFGPRGGKFTDMLSDSYPGIFFEVSNYAEANQNILQLPQRLNESVQADHDLLLEPIMFGEPDVIIIESFGYNPLSQLGTTNGLKKQEEVLTEVMTTLTNRFPNTVIIFLATIAPDKLTYGSAVTKSDPDARWQQGEERIEYITNHIDYAREHNIPLINAYQESLDSDGDGDTRYINQNDNIHPSEDGLSLIGRTMVRRLKEEDIFSIYD